MPAAFRSSAFAFLLAALLLATPAAGQGGAPRLFGPDASAQAMPRTQAAATVQARAVRPDLAAIERLAREHLVAGERLRFVLDLFPGVDLEAEVISSEVRATGHTVFARLTEIELGSAVLTFEAGVLIGSVSMPGANYLIRQQADGLYAIVRNVAHLARPEHPPIPVFVAPQAEDRFAPDIPADSGRLIDVMILWSPAAQTNAMGASAMQAIAQGSVDHANLVYLQSGVAQRQRLVHAELTAYAERNSGCAHPFGGSNGNNKFQCALFDITGAIDGHMDGVHALRNTHGADLVALLIHDDALCGLAWMPTTVSAASEAYGFSVSAWDCAVDQKTHVHEAGHNMGANHDPFVAPGPGAFAFSHGMVNVAGRWLTTMAYPNECLQQNPPVFDCATIDYFSNPNLTRAGAPLGTAAVHNNAHTLNKTAKAIASYRPTAAMHPVPQRFGDVTASHILYGYIEFFGQAGITAGCGGGNFCPDGTVSREAMAAFLERVKRAPVWQPPAAVGIFNDVPIGDAFAPWIEALYNDQITSGCVLPQPGKWFCPKSNVLRGQMAVFILRAKCGPLYVPGPPAFQRFNDVPPSHAFYAFVDKLARLQITTGCATPGAYCVDAPVLRSQMATFIERGFPADFPSEACTP